MQRDPKDCWSYENQKHPPFCVICEDLPDCSIIRPTLRKNAGPLAVVAFLTNMGLFQGQSQDFFEELHAIARTADKARRQLEEAEEEDIV